MRIHLSCHKCTQTIAEGESGIAYSKVVLINDSGTYVMECPAGHTSTIVLRTPKHEVLYLIAANAILDGYTREAILSFAASMERYFEFAIKVLARSKGIPPATLETAWSLIAKQSERQLGAIVMAWLFEKPQHFTEA